MKNQATSISSILNIKQSAGQVKADLRSSNATLSRDQSLVLHQLTFGKTFGQA